MELTLTDELRHAAPEGGLPICSDAAAPGLRIRIIARTLDRVSCQACIARMFERPQLWNLLRSQDLMRRRQRAAPMPPQEPPPRPTGDP